MIQSLSDSQTSPIYVPAGTTGLVQPLDVCFNAPFKTVVKRLADEHIRENLDEYVQGSIQASRRRILFSQWAWEEVSTDQDMVVRSFVG